MRGTGNERNNIMSAEDRLPEWKETRLRNWWAGDAQDTPCIAGWVLDRNARLPEAKRQAHYLCNPSKVSWQLAFTNTVQLKLEERRQI